MSIRVHVIGALGVSESDFRTVLAAAGCESGQSNSNRLTFGSSGNWQWARASVWKMNGSDIDETLASLPGPGIRVTSSDGILWTLTLACKGRKLFRGVHHFTQVGEIKDIDDDENIDDNESDEFDEDFPADELDEVAGINRYVPELQFLWDDMEEARLIKQDAEEQAEACPALEEYTDYGVTLPTDAVALIRQQSDERGYRTAFLAHATQIVDALGHFGIGCDRGQVMNLLTIGPLNDWEHTSDLGNMPRFLKLLGIEGVFGDDPTLFEVPVGYRDADAGSADEYSRMADDINIDWTQHPPGERFQQMGSLMESCPLSELFGGPIRLTLVQAAQLNLMAHLCAEDSQAVAVRLTFADSAQCPPTVWQSIDDVEAGDDAAGWLLVFNPSLWWYSCEEQEAMDNHKLVTCLRSLPDRTHVELTFLTDGLAEQCHRYSGTIDNHGFLLDRVYPEVTADQIREVLDIMQLIVGSQPIDLRTPAAEAAVRTAYERDTEDVARIRNGRIKPEYGTRDSVVRALFFERFRDLGLWDIDGAERLIAADQLEFQRILSGESLLDDDDDDLEDDDDDIDDGELDSSELECDDESGAGGSDEDPSSVTGVRQQLTAMMQQVENSKHVPRGEEIVVTGQSGGFFKAAMSDLHHISANSLKADDDELAGLGFEPVGDVVAECTPEELSRCYAGSQQSIALLGHRALNNGFTWVDDPDGMTMVDLSRGIREFHTHFEDGRILITNNVETVTSRPEREIYIRSYEGFSFLQLWEKHLDGIARFKTHKSTVPIDHVTCRQLERYGDLIDRLLTRYIHGSE